MQKEKNYTVRICEKYVLRESDKVKEILDRISRNITNTYKRQSI